ncbi:CsbD family protein [Methylobacterium sp. J-068]|uniref:CsbD family protein n=1 Tax=Methylobacterium sp. J-068 TaxID=2836649 RepID=UPI001FBBCE31|nr:CsbD family protein [Methylobacterium sp. J-068]MCJ2036077.1 CsbD family protein [Methylobacterium sp. J-068]
MSEPKSTVTTRNATADALEGSIKEAIGKLIGDGKVEAEGRAQQSMSVEKASPKSDVKSKPRPKP